MKRIKKLYEIVVMPFGWVIVCRNEKELKRKKEELKRENLRFYIRKIILN